MLPCCCSSLRACGPDNFLAGDWPAQRVITLASWLLATKIDLCIRSSQEKIPRQKRHQEFCFFPSSRTQCYEYRTGSTCVFKGTLALGLAAGTSTASGLAAVGQAANEQGPLPDKIAAALARFRATIPANFDSTYVENAVVPFFLTSLYEGERPLLPMIDLNLSKENALPYDLWGLLYKDWKPTPEEGVTVFLQGLEKRGDNNLRKRIYFSAVTPDLYRPMYGDKVVAFFDQLMAPQFADKPFMRHYLDYYFDIYWDLHLGVKGEAVPLQVRQIGEAFNTVLAYRDPLQPIVYENYMTVRNLLDFLKQWIDERVEDIAAVTSPILRRPWSGTG